MARMGNNWISGGSLQRFLQAGPKLNLVSVCTNPALSILENDGLSRSLPVSGCPVSTVNRDTPPSRPFSIRALIRAVCTPLFLCSGTAESMPSQAERSQENIAALPAGCVPTYAMKHTHPGLPTIADHNGIDQPGKLKPLETSSANSCASFGAANFIRGRLALGG